MFSATLEQVLNLSVREALVRRHAHLTLEHLLFAVAHDPQGEEILRACGVNLDKLRKDLGSFLDEMERLPKGREEEPSQTLAFRRVLQAAVLHVQAAGRDEANVGDVLAALFQQPRSHAVSLLTGQGVTRLDVLNYISHRVAKVPPAPSGDDEGVSAGDPGEGPAGATLADKVAALEKSEVEAALKRARGVKSRAAEMLGISRPTLDKKIADLAIDIWKEVQG